MAACSGRPSSAWLPLLLLLPFARTTSSPGDALPGLRARAEELQAVAVAAGGLTPAAAPSPAARALVRRADEAWRLVIASGERSGQRAEVHAARQRLGINLSIEGVAGYHDEGADIEEVGNLLGEGLAMVEWALAEPGSAPGSTTAERFLCHMYAVVNRYILLQASADSGASKRRSSRRSSRRARRQGSVSTHVWGRPSPPSGTSTPSAARRRGDWPFSSRGTAHCRTLTRLNATTRLQRMGYGQARSSVLLR